MTGDNRSIRTVVIWAMLFMAYIAWGVLAGSYTGNAHAADIVAIRSRRPGFLGLAMLALYSFVATSIIELPNFFGVLTWHFSNRIWLPILFFFLEAGILLGGFGLQKLEDNLSKSRRRRRH